jgi:phospholipase C
MMRRAHLLAARIAVAVIARDVRPGIRGSLACDAWDRPSARSGGIAFGVGGPPAIRAKHWPIKRVVFLIRETWTFDNLFGTFPGAEGVSFGYDRGVRRPLTPGTDGGIGDEDIPHCYTCSLEAGTTGRWTGSSRGRFPTGGPNDYGGFYERVPPPQVDGFGPGIRIPLLVISPRTQRLE